jgi:hypothetical protein
MEKKNEMSGRHLSSGDQKGDYVLYIVLGIVYGGAVM